MKTISLHAFSPRLGAALGAASLALLSGCGSGIGNSSGAAANATAPITAANNPQLGYFWNSADATLRPVLGIPGSSQVGQSVVAAGTYTTGAASSASGFAVLQESGGALDVMALPNGQPIHLNAATTTGAQIRFSPSGTSAIVFTPGSAAITRVTGLTSSPSASNVTAPSAIQDAALSDTGSIAFASGTSIQIIDTNGAATSVANVASLGGLAFASGDTLLFADAKANTLTLISNASTKPALALVPTTSLLKTPTGLGVSANGHWALVANSAEATTVRVDLTAQAAPLLIQCACTPALVATVSGAATFRITAPNGGPLWAVDAAVSTPRSFFIPALPGAAAVRP